MTYVIGYYKAGKMRFVRLYKNSNEWVERMSGNTATQFKTQQEALKIAAECGIRNPDIRTVG